MGAGAQKRDDDAERDGSTEGDSEGRLPEGDSEDRNAHSLVICADFGGFHIAFYGDMGKKQEREMLALAAEGRSGGGGGCRGRGCQERGCRGRGRGEETAREDRESLAALIGQHLAHAQVLKTAHHGSDGSSDERFLARMPLRAAVISYGRDKSYGHPSPRVVAALRTWGFMCLRRESRARLDLDRRERMKSKGFLR